LAPEAQAEAGSLTGAEERKSKLAARAENVADVRAKIRPVTPASRQIAEKLARIRERIDIAATRASRRPEDITLVAVSKTHPAEKIRELYEAGVRHFGENRVQEREAKSAQLADLDITWHMIGHLQKNKAARAASLFDTIDSVDSVALAEKLNQARNALTTESSNRSFSTNRLGVLIEVKLDPEPAKSGVGADEAPRIAEAILRLPCLELRGLMGVPPYFDNPEQARPYFRRLRELRDALTAHLGANRLPVLSMGMSHDFEVAIEEGATQVRIGTALFGERQKI
jgi:pyridoxal phosphate enzyme (YggS family)